MHVLYTYRRLQVKEFRGHQLRRGHFVTLLKRYLSQRTPQLNRSQRDLTGQAEAQSLL